MHFMTNQIEQISIYDNIYLKGVMLMNKIKLNNLQELIKIEEREFIINLECLNNLDKKSAMYFLSGLTFNNGVLKKINVNEFLVKCR